MPWCILPVNVNVNYNFVSPVNVNDNPILNPPVKVNAFEKPVNGNANVNSILPLYSLLLALSCSSGCSTVGSTAALHKMIWGSNPCKS